MVLKVNRVSRSFGPVAACSDVTFSAAPGEVVAVLGENGAGKSTLLSIIAGFVTPDTGSVLVNGTALTSGDPRASLRAGIGTAFQHFSLSAELTVAENFSLARIDGHEAWRRLPKHIPLHSPVAHLSVPERQQVEFLKARLLAAQVLLLDEPTSLLGGADAGRVLHGIREVATAGVACIFVTHRLREALAVADRIVVMRRGWVVERVVRPESGWRVDVERQLLAAMFGDVNVLDETPSQDREPEPPVAGRITIVGELGQRACDISLEMNRILAVAGIAGNGQKSLVDLLAGATAHEVRLDTGGVRRSLTGRSLARWFRRSVATVPEDRQQEGGAPRMSVGENLVLRDLASGRLSTLGLVGQRRLRRRARELAQQWDIRPADPRARFGALSGGNAQRVLLARALDPLPAVLVVERPTQGLDHHSVRELRRQLRAAAGAGTAVVTIEQDLDDGLAHADSIAVMYGGQLSEVVPATHADRKVLQSMMVSGWDA
jgi:general nucleoside transport system ATP-binding protein